MNQFIPFYAYEASAGSGKTFSLVVRYLSLLFMGEDAGGSWHLLLPTKRPMRCRSVLSGL